jgi:hypothetical protein
MSSYCNALIYTSMPMLAIVHIGNLVRAEQDEYAFDQTAVG